MIYNVTNGRTFSIYFEDRSDADNYASSFTAADGVRVIPVYVVPKGLVNASELVQEMESE